MKKSVLIVDDDKTILRSFARILQKHGFEVDTAQTGLEALAKAQNRHYDLLLLDIRLPDMEGTDLLFRAKTEFRDTAKIVITGFPCFETAVDALNGDVGEYLIKPVQPRELLAVVDDKLGCSAAS